MGKKKMEHCCEVFILCRLENNVLESAPLISLTDFIMIWYSNLEIFFFYLYFVSFWPKWLS